MNQKFSEFSEFRESNKSMKHELGSILRSSLLPVSCCCCGNYIGLSIPHTGGGRFE